MGHVKGMTRQATQRVSSTGWEHPVAGVEYRREMAILEPTWSKRINNGGTGPSFWSRTGIGGRPDGPGSPMDGRTGVRILLRRGAFHVRRSASADRRDTAGNSGGRRRHGPDTHLIFHHPDPLLPSLGAGPDDRHPGHGVRRAIDPRRWCRRRVPGGI